MAVLFRPWAQPDVLQQDDTISTTTTDVKAEKPEDISEDVSREVKFKCVKEHIRKRSEKKSRRSKLDPKKINQRSSTAHITSKEPIPLFSSTLCPPQMHHHPVPVSAGHLDQFGTANLDYWDDLGLSSPELVEAALAQGLPPGLLDDYIRVLTEQQRQVAERNRKQRPKKFRCPHCQVGFSNNGQLKGHIRIHTGERPFKCEAEHCGKSFTRNEELTRHRRIHSGLRPFPCPDCGKRFGRKDHLKKHVRTHYHQRYQLVPILPSHYPFLLGL